MGPVAQGVHETLLDYGIKEPRTALEMLAIDLANALDNLRYAKDQAPLSHELRMVLEAVANQPHAKPKQESDAISSLINSQS